MTQLTISCCSHKVKINCNVTKPSWCIEMEECQGTWTKNYWTCMSILLQDHIMISIIYVWYVHIYIYIWHNIRSFHVTSNHIIMSYHILWSHAISYHYHIILYHSHIKLQDMVHVRLHHLTYRITSPHLTSSHIIWHHIASNHITSCRTVISPHHIIYIYITSYNIVYDIISYHIISPPPYTSVISRFTCRLAESKKDLHTTGHVWWRTQLFPLVRENAKRLCGLWWLVLDFFSLNLQQAGFF